MSKKFCNYIDTAIDSVPKQVELKLPKLKKANAGSRSEPWMGSDSNSKVKLPKLKKIEI